MPQIASLNRRQALKLLSSAVALTMAGCAKPEETIVPYVDMPERLVPGEPLRFATALMLSGYARGFHAISIDGRPIKIEGNPKHPHSLGATDVFAEAEVLSLYDPDRSQVVREGSAPSTWDAFRAAWARTVARLDARGSALALVTGRVVSPTTLRCIDRLRSRFPQLRWYRFEAVNDDHARAGVRLAFGRELTALPRLQEADVIVCLGADPLGHGPAQLRNARAFAAGRGDRRTQRLFVAEPAWTLTGAMADMRLACHPASLVEIGRVLCGIVDVSSARLDEEGRAFASRAARAMVGKRALILVGESQPSELNAAAHWINQRLKAPVDYIAPIDPVSESHADSFSALTDDLEARRIDALVIVDANPVYHAPDSRSLAQAIKVVPFSAHLGLHNDETAAACKWRLPMSHALESWGDGRAPDGTASLIQPLIRTLYDTKTADELLTFLAAGTIAKGYDLVRATWAQQDDFEKWWRQSLSDGVVAESVVPIEPPAARLPDLAPATERTGLVLALSADPSLWDGRFANNAWLQECPKPFTKEVWGNAIHIAPEDARRLGIQNKQTLRIKQGKTSIESTAVIMPGQAPGVLSGYIGSGRTEAGVIGTGIGNDLAKLASRAFERIFAVEAESLGARGAFYSTQGHTQLRGPDEKLFPMAALGAAIGSSQHKAEPPSLLAIPVRGQYAWAMVIDDDKCIGCNACVVACQAENNVPVVGPNEIRIGRDMHWLRVDAFSREEGDALRRGFQPVPCMHCELAPCEPVCPVGASIHDHEGLNVQVYNRCIGTRFCEANCPYKVRRFNWYDYNRKQAYKNQGDPPLLAQRNPDVSVRGRGVMEKCNYCLQRISRARKTAEKADRNIADGEVVTACQAACPTRAIQFGDLNLYSEVKRLRESARHFTLLEELNTRPRTTYLKRLYAQIADEDAHG